jgi:DNA excision repair protein ERCC-8
MNSFLLNRQLGSICPQALSAAQNQRLLSALQLAPNTKFHWRFEEHATSIAGEDGNTPARSELHSKAHAAGVNAITIDRFEGR